MVRIILRFVAKGVNGLNWLYCEGYRTGQWFCIRHSSESTDRNDDLPECGVLNFVHYATVSHLSQVDELWYFFELAVWVSGIVMISYCC